MLTIRMLAAPLLGGIIGYITNDLAIRMLFRPRRAYYIGKRRVPFTPGLIPSQKGRIAASIGGVISQELLNEQTLRDTLLSEGAVQKLQDGIRSFLRGLSEDRRTLNGMLKLRGMRGDKQQIDVEALQARLTDALAARIVEAKLGYAVVDGVLGNRMEAISQNKLFALLVDAGTQESIKEKLAGMIDDLIADRSHDVAVAVVGKARAEIFDMRICDIYEKYRDKEEMVIQKGTELYVSLLGGNLGRLLRAINIEQIVVDKINAFDAAQLEAMIFGIMKRELRAIVYLGAFLGFIMGFVNLLMW